MFHFSDIVEESELYMFDDEDDLNSDFAPLCRKDDVYKYEFPKLALLRRQKAAAPNAGENFLQNNFKLKFS